jgi:dolichyl-phosphate beta-glucosyltransferase
LAYELILVDDGSVDSTKAICHEIIDRNSHVRLISYPDNRGKGHALRTGMLEANGKYVIFADADLAVPVHFIGECLTRLETGPPVLIGSRHLAESSFKVREGALRQFLGEVFRRGTKLLLGLRVSDITCGLKGFEKQAVLDIFSRARINRWGCDAEIIFLARKLGYAIGEIPVDWHHSFDSKVSVAKDCIRTLKELFQIFHNFLIRRYE